MRLAEALALHVEMQKRIAALRAQLEPGAARLSREQEQAQLDEIEVMTAQLVAQIMCLSRTNTWLLMARNKRRA